jgi:hypothetical protein
MTHSFDFVSSLRSSVGAVLVAASLMGCAGSRYGLEEPSYPGIEVESRVLTLRIADPRLGVSSEATPVRPRDLRPGASAATPVALPPQFVPAAAQRLGEVVAGEGPTLEVVAEVDRADVVWSRTSAGTTARVNVAFTFSVYAANGALLQRGSGRAMAQVPGDAVGTDVVRATALEAFDRYWASEQTLVGLNQAIGARG